MVTGAARGIGKAIASRLAEDGAHVIVSDIDGGGALEAVAAIRSLGLRASSLQLDVTNGASVEAAVQDIVASFGRLDILVNNAGSGRSKPFLEVTEEDLEAQMALNFRAAYICAQSCAKVMKSAGYGRIIFTTSVTALAGPIDLSAYGSMKAGQMGLVRAMALELGEFGITANSVAPGPTDTELLRAAWPADMIEEAADRIPARRIGKPEEVAHAVSFLASPGAAFTNGISIPVDGGFTAGGGYLAEVYRRRKVGERTSSALPD